MPETNPKTLFMQSKLSKNRSKTKNVKFCLFNCLFSLVEPEYKILQIPCGFLAVPCNSVYALKWNTKSSDFRAIPCRFRVQNTKIDMESGNSCKVRVRRMHSIETDLAGTSGFLVRFYIPCQPGFECFLLTDSKKGEVIAWISSLLNHFLIGFSRRVSNLRSDLIGKLQVLQSEVSTELQNLQTLQVEYPPADHNISRRRRRSSLQNPNFFTEVS